MSVNGIKSTTPTHTSRRTEWGCTWQLTSTQMHVHVWRYSAHSCARKKHFSMNAHALDAHIISIIADVKCVVSGLFFFKCTVKEHKSVLWAVAHFQSLVRYKLSFDMRIVSDMLGENSLWLSKIYSLVGSLVWTRSFLSFHMAVVRNYRWEGVCVGALEDGREITPALIMHSYLCALYYLLSSGPLSCSYSAGPHASAFHLFHIISWLTSKLPSCECVRLCLCLCLGLSHLICMLRFLRMPPAVSRLRWWFRLPREQTRYAVARNDLPRSNIFEFACVSVCEWEIVCVSVCAGGVAAFYAIWFQWPRDIVQCVVQTGRNVFCVSMRSWVRRCLWQLVCIPPVLRVLIQRGVVRYDWPLSVVYKSITSRQTQTTAASFLERSPTLK